MEDMNQTQPVIDTMPTMKRSADTAVPHHAHRMLFRVLSIILGVIIVAALVLFGYALWRKHHQPARTPEQALSDLEKASYTDSGTDDHKGVTLNALEKSSRPNPVSEKDQLQTLNDLRQ